MPPTIVLSEIWWASDILLPVSSMATRNDFLNSVPNSALFLSFGLLRCLLSSVIAILNPPGTKAGASRRGGLAAVLFFSQS